MSERNDTARSGSQTVAVVAIVVVFLMVPALYVLGIGPAIMLHQRGIAQGALEVIYYPLEVSYEHLGPLQKPLDWYASLWMDR